MGEDTLPEALFVRVLTPCEGLQEVAKIPNMTQYVGSAGSFDRVTLMQMGNTWQAAVTEADPSSACYGRRYYRLDTPSGDPRGGYSYWTGSGLDPALGTLLVYDV